MSTQPLTLSLDSIVDVIVEVSPLVPSPPQFNQGLILGNSPVIPSWGGVSPRLRQYTNVNNMLLDGFLLTSPEVIAAQLYFGQSPPPLYLWVGRQDSSGTSLSGVNVATGGTGYSLGDVVIISGGTGGKAKVTAVVSNGVVTGLAIVQDGTGYSAATSAATTGGTGSGLTVNTTVGPESLIAAMQYCRAANYAWYGCYACGAKKADNEALGDWAQSASPPTFYFFNTNDTDVPTQAATDVFTYLMNNSDQRCLGVYSTDQGGTYPNNLFSGAAVMGKALGLNTGLANSYFTMKFEPLVGVSYEPLTATQVQAICGLPGAPGKNGNLYSNYANTYTILHEGVVPSGNFFDEIINLDLLRVAIQYNVMNLLVANPAIPQNDVGQTQLIHAVNQAIDQMVTTGFISPGVWNGPQVLNLTPGQALPKGYFTQSQPYSVMTPALKAQRQAMPIYASIIESGAVHFVTIGVYVQR